MLGSSTIEQVWQALVPCVNQLRPAVSGRDVCQVLTGLASRTVPAGSWRQWLHRARREIRRRVSRRTCPMRSRSWPRCTPSIFRNRYPLPMGALERTPDQQDTYAVASWLEETTRRGFLCRYLSPPLTDSEGRLAEREGWRLGVA